MCADTERDRFFKNHWRWHSDASSLLKGESLVKALELSEIRARETHVTRPFLLSSWVKLRPYQQIGLNWLVSLQSRRLNGKRNYLILWHICVFIQFSKLFPYFILFCIYDTLGILADEMVSLRRVACSKAFLFVTLWCYSSLDFCIGTLQGLGKTLVRITMVSIFILIFANLGIR